MYPYHIYSIQFLYIYMYICIYVYIGSPRGYSLSWSTRPASQWEPYCVAGCAPGTGPSAWAFGSWGWCGGGFRCQTLPRKDAKDWKSIKSYANWVIKNHGNGITMGLPFQWHWGLHTMGLLGPSCVDRPVARIILDPNGYVQLGVGHYRWILRVWTYVIHDSSI